MIDSGVVAMSSFMQARKPPAAPARSPVFDTDHVNNAENSSCISCRYLPHPYLLEIYKICDSHDCTMFNEFWCLPAVL